MKSIMVLAIVFTFLLIPALPDDQLTQSEALKRARASDWRTLDPENTLYMELETGRVIIELAPDFAPNHVANIKALVRERFFDGLAIVRVQENYVVQWGDPHGEDPEKAREMKQAQRSLPPEFSVDCNDQLPFTPLPDPDPYAPEVGFVKGFPAARDTKTGKMWLTHCYGMVGAGRGNAPDSGSGAEMYVVCGHAPRHLDRNVTLFGRVIRGMELLTVLPRGKGVMGFYAPDQPLPRIQSIRLAAQVPESERDKLEILRTDSRAFQAFIQARRNRAEDWFLYKADGLDIGNIQVPRRVKDS